MYRAQRFRGLRVWNEAIELARAAYRFTESFPMHEQFGLSSQLRRAATSVASNIAEGSTRSKRDFRRFIGIALGSLAEVETQVEIARGMYVSSDAVAELEHRVQRVRMMLYRLHKYLAQATRADHGF